MKITNCRLCQGELSLVLSLGKLPIVNYFPTKEESFIEKMYPLDFCVCDRCGLAQLNYIIPPQKLFNSYHYISGASLPLVEHLNSLAQLCLKWFDISSDSKVLDIGCNDGSMLSRFKAKGALSVGIDPAVNAINMAREKGLEVINDFFDGQLALSLDKQYGKFDLITITHTLANIVDLHDFMYGVKKLLNKRGVVVIEVGSLVQMVKKGQFDAIYHEHYCYFSLPTISLLLKTHGLEIFKAEINSCHGGSIRVFATHRQHVSNTLQFGRELTKQEYAYFVKTTKEFKKRLTNFFEKQNKGKTCGFGAPAKGVALLNFCQLGKETIPFIVDSTPQKQGKLLPGMHIPIYPENYLQDKNFNNFFLLAWNYKDEIFKKIHKYSSSARVIIPFPNFEIVEA